MLIFQRKIITAEKNRIKENEHDWLIKLKAGKNNNNTEVKVLMVKCQK